ncbi:LapA family protein, partial [Hydrogenophaga sp.]|uniref:LapA family protein n=1 Tax=Hydrogenophaga sp. TaxID=1904254 RepID=UPI003565F020
MSLRSLLILVLGFVTVLFVGANWALISQPAQLSLLVMTVEAPLGIVLLGLLLLFVLVFVAYIGYLQTTVLVESRRHAKELAAQRALADKAEASRFFELKSHLDGAFDQVNQLLEKDFKNLGEQVDAVEA